MRNAYYLITTWSCKLFIIIFSHDITLFQVHSYVNVESTLKACLVGPLVEDSPTTQRRNSASIMSKAAKLRRESFNLIVPKPVMITDGKQTN